MKTLSALFKNATLPNIPDGLDGRILRQIEILQQNHLKRSLFITRIGRFLSLGALFSAGFSFGHTIITSDFWKLLLLLFSDREVIMRYFSDFLISLLETFPAFSLSLILAPIFFFFLFQFWSQNVLAGQKHIHAYN